MKLLLIPAIVLMIYIVWATKPTFPEVKCLTGCGKVIFAKNSFPLRSTLLHYQYVYGFNCEQCAEKDPTCLIGICSMPLWKKVIV